MSSISVRHALFALFAIAATTASTGCASTDPEGGATSQPVISAGAKVPASSTCSGRSSNITVEIESDAAGTPKRLKGTYTGFFAAMCSNFDQISHEGTFSADITRIVKVNEHSVRIDVASSQGSKHEKLTTYTDAEVAACEAGTQKDDAGVTSETTVPFTFTGLEIYAEPEDGLPAYGDITLVGAATSVPGVSADQLNNGAECATNGGATLALLDALLPLAR